MSMMTPMDFQVQVAKEAQEQYNKDYKSFMEDMALHIKAAISSNRREVLYTPKHGLSPGGEPSKALKDAMTDASLYGYEIKIIPSPQGPFWEGQSHRIQITWKA